MNYGLSIRSSANPYWSASKPVVTRLGSNPDWSGLEELGHEVWLGDAAEIRRRARRRQKNDRRDAELILDLMVHDEFPRVHRPSSTSREIMRMLRYRHKLVKIRTLSKNSVHCLAVQSGLTSPDQLRNC